MTIAVRITGALVSSYCVQQILGYAADYSVGPISIINLTVILYATTHGQVTRSATSFYPNDGSTLR